MEDERFIRRCIELARNGEKTAAPNPMVGAVVVYNGRIVGEGWHIRCGEAHAEVNAIRSVYRRAESEAQAEEWLRQATIYVSLEPCSHYGKTPPCADLIIEKQIPRIVVGCQDPFARVAGRGIQKLRDAGREVVVGVCESECRQLIRRFITFHTKQRPYITLKWAESADGYIDRRRTAAESPTIISTPLTQMRAHRLRSEHSAILVGSRTALMDNPSLNVRHWSGPQPLRIVLNRHFSLPASLHLLDGSQPTWVITEQPGPATDGVEYLTPIYDGTVIEQLLKALHQAGKQSLLVEGGRELLQVFIDLGLWDEAIVEESPALIGAGTPAPSMPPHTSYRHEVKFGRYYRHYLTAFQ